MLLVRLSDLLFLFVNELVSCRHWVSVAVVRVSVLLLRLRTIVLHQARVHSVQKLQYILQEGEMLVFVID